MKILKTNFLTDNEAITKLFRMFSYILKIKIIFKNTILLISHIDQLLPKPDSMSY